MKTQNTNPIVTSLPASAYALRSSKACHYGLYFARLNGETETIGLPGDKHHQTIHRAVAATAVASHDTREAKYSGTQGLPRIGERVLIAHPYKCEGTVLAYFIEDGWLGVELLPDTRPAHVNAKTHPHALMFGLDLTRKEETQTPATPQAEELHAIRATLGLPLNASRADVLAAIDRLKLVNAELISSAINAQTLLVELVKMPLTGAQRETCRDVLGPINAALSRAEGRRAPGPLSDAEARELAGYLHTRHSI